MNVITIPFKNQRLASFRDAVYAAINELPETISVAEVIGVLEIVKRDLIEGLPSEE